MKFKIEIEGDGLDDLREITERLSVSPRELMYQSEFKTVNLSEETAREIAETVGRGNGTLATGGSIKVDDLPFVGEKVTSLPSSVVNVVSTTKIPSDTSGLPFDVTVSDSLPPNAAYIQTSDKPGDFKRVDMSTPIETGDGQQLPEFTGVDLTSDEDDQHVSQFHPVTGRNMTVEPEEATHVEASTNPALDVRGLPWDERIHASTKAKLASGAWRSRRGVSDELVKQVEAELRGSPAPVVADTPLEQAIAEVTEPVTQTQTAPVSNYQLLIHTINALMASGAIKFDYLTTLVKAIDDEFLDVTVNSITDIMHDAEMIEFAFEQLRTDGKIS